MTEDGRRETGGGIQPIEITPVVEEYVASLTGGDPNFVREIHPADEMFSWNLQSLRGSREAAAVLYFSTGRQIAETIFAARRWRFGRRKAGTLLDFASGFGRATRYLVREISPDAVWICDVDPDAVAFCEASFGVRGLVSTAQAEAFAPGRRFDTIAASSFFSHMPADRFEEWLARLYALLAPGGLLLFSVHGQTLLSEPADWSAGIVFRGESETRRIDPEDYGTSWVLPEFVREAAARASGGEGLLHFEPFGLCGHQDLYLLSSPPALPEAVPAIPRVPRGELDALEIRGRESLIAGGFVESGSEAEVLFLVRNEIRQICPALSGGARSRWRFEIASRDIAPDDLLRIEARTRAGVSRILAMGTLRPFLSTLPDSSSHLLI